MYLLLGISILLALLLAFNSVASIAASALWRLLGRWARDWSADTRARALFVLRVIPAAAGVAMVMILLAPAYVINEPRTTEEPVSLKLALIAIASALGLALALIRGIASWRATSRLLADWLSKGQLISIPEVKVPAYRIQHRFPVIAIVGAWRPRLFIASQVFDSLTTEEISAALAHENGHLATRDNLKRGLLRACRDVLLIIPCGRHLDRAWAEASEEAADEFAARGGRRAALDLASALVKIARMIPAGARPMMPAGIFLIGDKDTGGVKTRVRRLLDLAARNQSGTDQSVRPSRFLGPSSLALVGLLSVLATSNSNVLETVHSMIEHFVFILR